MGPYLIGQLVGGMNSDRSSRFGDHDWVGNDGILYGDTSNGGTSNDGVFFSLKVPGLTPFVSLLPYSGKVGATIEFLGQGFTSTSTVSFNGTAVKPTSVSGTYLTAAVPSGATTGFVTVTTSSGTLKSNKIFRVIPQITSFSQLADRRKRSSPLRVRASREPRV